jgi:hypothetical protein
MSILWSCPPLYLLDLPDMYAQRPYLVDGELRCRYHGVHVRSILQVDIDGLPKKVLEVSKGSP